MSKLKNKRSLYWGGNQNTIIPRMGACGEGVEVEPPEGGGDGGVSPSGQPTPEKPKRTFKVPNLSGLFDKLKAALPLLALGALVAAVVAGAIIMLRKNRDDGAGGSAVADAGDGLGDGFGSFAEWIDDFTAAENFANLGFDIETPTVLDVGPPDGIPPDTASPFIDPSGNIWFWNPLPLPGGTWRLDNDPDFVGQEIIDEDGNFWIYKDPPGAWINFGPGSIDIALGGGEEPGYQSTGEDIQVAIYESYLGVITDVIDDTELVIDESWSSMGEMIGHVGNDTPNLFYDWKITYSENEKDLYTYLLFDDDKSSLIVNYREDIDSYAEYPHSIVYKLYEPLLAEIEEGDLCYIVKEMAPPYIETVQLIDFVEEDIDAVVLRYPEWDTGVSADSYFDGKDTKFRSYDDLVSNVPMIKEALENEIISGSFLESIELTGVNYSNWDNFMHFSSIEDRLKNFKTKLQKIELYTSQSDSLSGISGSLTYAQTSSLAMKVRKVKNELTPFESYMHFQSSSYYTSSLGAFHDNAWPKSGGAGTVLYPYILYPVTSSQAISWYDTQISSASLYDRRNRDRLLNNIPDHILNDSANLPFHTFINMAGEHFDGIWTYINEIPQIYDRRQKLTEGLSRDLIYAVATSFGFYLNDGKDLISLPRYLIGMESTGSGADVTLPAGNASDKFTVYSTNPEREISREIWKRLINNMPFFLKTKGTLRSFKGLITCYGIPSSILRVKEYGGPDPNPDLKPSYMISRKFTKAVNFKSSQYIQSTWANDTNSGRKPDTIEFRFKAASGSNQTLFQAGTDWAIRLKDNNSADNNGYVSFVLTGGGGDGDFELLSNSLPIYDGEFYSVMLTRVSASIGDGANHYSGSSLGQLTSDSTSQNIIYSLYVKQYDSGVSRILRSSFVSASIDGATSSSWHSSFVGDETAYIGGVGSTFGAQFTGSMMEFRYWNSALNSGSFENHVAAPKAFDGNHPSASWTDLVLRYSFDDNTNLDSFTSIRDTSADQSYTQVGTAVGYSTGNRPHFSSIVDEQKAQIPNIGPNRRTENKIRIEESRLVFGDLSVNKRAELSAYDVSPLDSNKLGIYFSPADVINEDIILSVANLDFDQYIGDPRDKYKYRYRELENIATTYWQKYKTPNNFWDYIRLIRYYDTSLFEQLRKFVPARARASLGLLIEPNILERKKLVIGAPPTFEDLLVRGDVNMYVQSASAETLPLTASIPPSYPSLSGSELSYEASMSAAVQNVSGSYLSYAGSASLEISTIGSYLSYAGSASLETFVSGSYLSYAGSASFETSAIGSYLSYAGSASFETFASGSYDTYGGSVTSSRYKPALYQLSSSVNPDYGYQDYNITIGGPARLFEEALQPSITGSRLSDHNYYTQFFYTSSEDALQDHGYTWDTERRNFSSSSLHKSEIQSVGYDNAYFRLVYSGCLQTKYTTLDKEAPVTIKITSPTILVTQEAGESKLKIR